MNNLDKSDNLIYNTTVTPKTIEIFSAFAVTLKRIHLRLIAEGYSIEDGRIIKPDKLLSYENENKPSRKSK